jgi:hypothetical protein
MQAFRLCPLADRRSFLNMATAGSIALTTGIARGETGSAVPDAADDLYPRGKRLDDAIRTWWDGPVQSRRRRRSQRSQQDTDLPSFPYSSGGGSESKFSEIYGRDTPFINLAFLQYGRPEIVRWHIVNLADREPLRHFSDGGPARSMTVRSCER